MLLPMEPHQPGLSCVLKPLPHQQFLHRKFRNGDLGTGGLGGLCWSIARCVALVTAVIKGSDANPGTSKSSQAPAAWRLSIYSSPVLLSGLRAREGPIASAQTWLGVLKGRRGWPGLPPAVRSALCRQRCCSCVAGCSPLAMTV